MIILDNTDLAIEISIHRNLVTGQWIDLKVQSWVHDMGSGQTHTTLTLPEVMDISNQLRRYAMVMAAGIDPESNL